MSETLEQLGPYQLQHRIAVGGMGEIYLAKVSGPVDFEKTVIIKRILPHLASEEKFVNKFVDEARIVVNLTHSNIVSIFDMGEQDGEYYIAMEYVPGRDLRDILKHLDDREQTLPVGHGVYVVTETCKGLSYAHRKTDESGQNLGIVHRDISPSNLLVSKEGEVKVIDFGVARAAGRISKTMSGRIQGKCAYMSPEQAEGGKVDARSDIFSIGTVLYEALTDVRPFQGDTDLESLQLVRECEFEPPSKHRPEVWSALDDILDKCLARDPDERYQTADDLQKDLLEAARNEGGLPRGQQVAEFLKSVFPDGYEPETLKEARTSSSEAQLGLNEAMDRELAKLGDTPSASPSPTPDAKQTDSNTATLHKKSAEPSSADPPTGPGVQSPTTATAATPPATRRWMFFGAVLTALGFAGGLLLAYQPFSSSSPPPGKLDVVSEPNGAKVHLDNSQIHTKNGPARTPFTYQLPPGTHQLKLTKKGFEPRIISFRVKQNTTVELAPPETKLEPASADQPQKTFRIETDPPNGTLFKGEKPLGQAPTNIELAPGEVVEIHAQKQDCKQATSSLGYAYAKETLVVELNCPEPEPDPEPDAGSESSTKPPPEKPPPEPFRKRLTIESKPSGATVFIDGQKLGQAPASRLFTSPSRIDIKLEKQGYKTTKRSVHLGNLQGSRVKFNMDKKPQGCLDFSAIQPQLAKIAIDGEWLPKKRGRLKNHKLPAGTHKITVQNLVANKKPETHTVQIKPGNDCTFLKVWDPQASD